MIARQAGLGNWLGAPWDDFELATSFTLGSGRDALNWLLELVRAGSLAQGLRLHIFDIVR